MHGYWSNSVVFFDKKPFWNLILWMVFRISKKCFLVLFWYSAINDFFLFSSFLNHPMHEYTFFHWSNFVLVFTAVTIFDRIWWLILPISHFVGFNSLQPGEFLKPSLWSLSEMKHSLSVVINTLSWIPSSLTMALCASFFSTSFLNHWEQLYNGLKSCQLLWSFQHFVVFCHIFLSKKIKRLQKRLT